MPIRIKVHLIGVAVLVALVACSPPQTQPAGPTPIPTLIPATLPVRVIDPVETPVLIVESFPAGVPSASDGQSLFVSQCAECHGEDGKGLLPSARDFGDVDYMRGETPAEFYTIISEGRGDDMPAFANTLTSDERWDIVYYIWRFSTTDVTLLSGRELYASSCIACHGETGRSMILGAANFSDPRYSSRQSPSDFYVAITQGRGSMPAYQARLDQDDRWAVIDYIRTFNYDATLGDEIALADLDIDTIDSRQPDCSPYLELTNPFEWDDSQQISAGEALYTNCAGCHAEDGTGEIPGILDFTNPVFQGELEENQSKYLCSIAEGINDMFGWKDVLATEEMWQLLVYMASLE